MAASSTGRRAGALTAPFLLCAIVLLAAAPAAAATTGGRFTPAVGVRPHFRSAGKPTLKGSSVLFSCQLPTTTFPCYGPSQMQRAYNIDELYGKGIDGTGRTIVVVDAFQNPYIRQELADFDADWGLPAINLQIVAPDGLTPFDVNDDNMVGWSGEISLDVQWAHAIAPKAKIVLALARSNEDADIASVLRYVIKNNLGDVVSMSFGEAEQCLDPAIDAAQHKLFAEAARKGITLIASSGDDGAAQPGCREGDPYVLAASSPANDPGVLGVGGTNLTADLTTGAYKSEVAWDDGYGLSGGGFSKIYSKPTYQSGFVSGKQRGLPDVAYNGGVYGGVLVYWYVPFAPGTGPGSVWIFGGTSAGAPQWSGITALLVQACGHRIGLLNDDLYSKGAYSWYYHDITKGNNVFPGLGGYTTSKGWDPVTGLGTPRASHIVYALSGIS